MCVLSIIAPARALLLRRSIFEKLDGFDEQFAPGYYEDTDLAFRVREQGLSVLYQPDAQIVHFEGISAGRNTDSGMKQYQVRNRDLFFKKWETTLRSHHSPKKILVVDSTLPTHDHDSGSLRMFGMLQALTQLSYDVTFAPEAYYRAQFLHP